MNCFPNLPKSDVKIWENFIVCNKIKIIIIPIWTFPNGFMERRKYEI